MSDHRDEREEFLLRWSRRKREHSAGLASTPELSKAASAQESDTFADFDFEALNFGSDYTRFMAGAVPEHVQRTALRKLWTSTDIIAEADELDDYLEDFREETMALPAEMVRSAYRIGRGFVEDGQDADEDTTETDEQLNAPEHGDGQSASAEASSVTDYHNDGARGYSESSVMAADVSGSESTESDKLSS